MDILEYTKHAQYKAKQMTDGRRSRPQSPRYPCPAVDNKDL